MEKENSPKRPSAFDGEKKINPLTIHASLHGISLSKKSPYNFCNFVLICTTCTQ